MSSTSTRAPAALLAIASLVVLASCSSDSASPTSSAVSQGSAAASPGADASASVPSASVPSASPADDSIDERAVAIIDNVAGEPDWPLEGFGSVWLLALDQEEPALLRVDPETNEIVATIRLPGNECQGFTVTDDAVWACTPEGAVRIDPATNEIVGEVAFQTGPVQSRLAFGAGSVWALGLDDTGSGTLVRIDPAAMSATPIPLGHGAATVAYGFDAVWVTAPQEGTILRIDPASGEVTEHTADLPRPWVIVVGADSLWVTLFGSQDGPADEPTVARIDPIDGSVLAEIATGAASEDQGGLWATEDAVWVRARGVFLTRIDPATNEVVERLSGPVSAGDVTVAFGSVWATAGNALTVYRLTP